MVETRPPRQLLQYHTGEAPFLACSDVSGGLNIGCFVFFVLFCGVWRVEWLLSKSFTFLGCPLFVNRVETAGYLGLFVFCTSWCLWISIYFSSKCGLYEAKTKTQGNYHCAIPYVLRSSAELPSLFFWVSLCLFYVQCPSF